MPLLDTTKQRSNGSTKIKNPTSPARIDQHKHDLLYFYSTCILPVVGQHSVGQYEPTFLVSLDVVGPLEQPSLHVLVVLHRRRRTPFGSVDHPVGGEHGRRMTQPTVSRGFSSGRLLTTCSVGPRDPANQSAADWVSTRFPLYTTNGDVQTK